MMNKLKKHDDQQTMTIAPHVNIFEKEKEIVLELEMPGVDKQSMEVSLDNNKLFIKGNRNKEDLDKSYTALHRERSSFDYERAFELNMDVDHEKLSATYTNGILTISLAKSEKTLPKKITIQS